MSLATRRHRVWELEALARYLAPIMLLEASPADLTRWSETLLGFTAGTRRQGQPRRRVLSLGLPRRAHRHRREQPAGAAQGAEPDATTDIARATRDCAC
jgi:hypothetical protein